MINYDALSKEFDTLEIEVDTFIGHQEINETIELTGRETTTSVGDQLPDELSIKELYYEKSYDEIREIPVKK